MVTFAPLATSADFNATPFANMANKMAAGELTRIMQVGTRHAEALTGNLLAPFQVTETCRLQDGDVEDLVPTGLPLPAQAQMGLSKSSAMNLPSLVRHAWVRRYPRVHEDLWTGSVSSVAISWALQAAPFAVATNQWHFEADTGHLMFLAGTFTPPGSSAAITYTGGYTTVPDDLKQACMMLAAAALARELDPEDGSHDPDVLRAEAQLMLVPYGATPPKGAL